MQWSIRATFCRRTSLLINQSAVVKITIVIKYITRSHIGDLTIFWIACVDIIINKNGAIHHTIIRNLTIHECFIFNRSKLYTIENILIVGLFWLKMVRDEVWAKNWFIIYLFTIIVYRIFWIIIVWWHHNWFTDHLRINDH